jgi:hypothetical protein
VSSTPLPLMANVTELAVAGNADADRVEADHVTAAATKAVADARSVTITEADRLVAEANRLVAEATQAGSSSSSSK